jgi:hypothetical protein
VQWCHEETAVVVIEMKKSLMDAVWLDRQRAIFILDEDACHWKDFNLDELTPKAIL